MSFPTKPQNTHTNGSLPTKADPRAIHAALLSSADQPDDLADENLAELLQQLDRADGVARETEGKLDSLLAQLDGMLEGLEAESPPSAAAPADSRSRTAQGPALSASLRSQGTEDGDSTGGENNRGV